VDQGTSRTRDDLTPPTKAKLDPVDPRAKTAVGAKTPNRSDLLICCPLAEEYHCVRKALAGSAIKEKSIPKDVYAKRNAVYRIGRWRYWVVQTGLGSNTAKTAAQLMPFIDPDAVCLLGFAGAIVPWLRVGQSIEPTYVVSEVENRPLFPSNLNLSSCRQAMVTIREIAATEEAKRELHERFDAWAVDMEAFELGVVCEEFGKPFHVARSISDASNDVIPIEFAGIVTTSGDLSIKRLAGALLKKPSLVRSLMRLWENSGLAKERLHDIVQRLVNALA